MCRRETSARLTTIEKHLQTQLMQERDVMGILEVVGAAATFYSCLILGLFELNIQG